MCKTHHHSARRSNFIVFPNEREGRLPQSSVDVVANLLLSRLVQRVRLRIACPGVVPLPLCKLLVGKEFLDGKYSSFAMVTAPVVYLLTSLNDASDH